MKQLKGWAETGVEGSRIEFDFDVDDDATEEDIERALEEEMWNHINVGYEEK